MIEVVEFEPAHLDAIALQVEQAGEPALGLPPAALHAGGPAFTVFHGERPICCAGFHVNHPGYATAWAFLAAGKGAAMVELTRAVGRVLDAAPWRRVDTLVRSDWAAAGLWADRLGFARDGQLPAYGLNGEDYDVYSRVRR